MYLNDAKFYRYILKCFQVDPQGWGQLDHQGTLDSKLEITPCSQVEQNLFNDLNDGNVTLFKIFNNYLMY